jgi:hypothetical protein
MQLVMLDFETTPDMWKLGVLVFLEFKGGTPAFILQRPTVKHLYIIRKTRKILSKTVHSPNLKL